MRKWLGVSVISIGALIALFFLFAPVHTVLRITAGNKGQALLCAQMAEGEEFIFSFVHSVNQRPVYDTLRVEKDHLLIVQSRFDSFGAGMPETSTETMKLQFDKEGWLVWTVNRPVQEIDLFVGRVAHHKLHLKGKEILLASLAKPGTSLSLRTEKASFYDIWKGRCIR